MDSPSKIANAVLLVENVKKRFSHQEKFKFNKFCSLMRDYKRRVIELQRLASEVDALFTGQPDLISSFRNFMPKSSQIAIASAGDGDEDAATTSCSAPKLPRSSGSRGDDKKPKPKGKNYGKKESKSCTELAMESCIEFVNRVAKTLSDDQKFKLFLGVVNGFWEHKEIDRVRGEVYHIFKDYPELDIEFSRFLADSYEAKSDVEETNFSFLFKRSKRAEGGKLPEKTEDEKCLFQCEDQMFESDRKYHLVESTLNAVDEILKKLQRDDNVPVYAEEYLSVLNFKCLRDWFGDHYVSKMRGNPVDQQEIVMLVNSLNKEFMELKRDREIVKGMCAETIKECHQKADRQTRSDEKESAKRSSPESMLEVDESKQVRHSKRIKLTCLKGFC